VSAAAWLAGGGNPSPGGERLLSALRKVAEAQREYGERACRTLILSMAHTADDMLAALACARACGLWDNARGGATVDVVPLFETLDALNQAPSIMRTLFAHPDYRRHLQGREAQEVMVGYSDSGKEVGLLAAAGALRRAQVELPKLAREAGIALRIFHGRGESVARGGGPAQQGILALPKGSVAGHYKATEQGEALDHKYARPEVAMRTLELVIGGALLHTLDAQEGPPAADEERYTRIFDELAEEGRRAYRSLVWEEPHFVEFFSTATPLDEIARLPIGSRPSKRRAGGLESLRAIPWVFAWTQTRCILPGWYGVGSALEAVGSREGGAELLAEMLHRWPFFRTVLDNVQMVLAKTDLAIAGRYAELSPKAAQKAVWSRIKAEHALTEKWIKRLFGVRRLLDDNVSLQRSFELRNPYIDPLSFLQVALLQRKRKNGPDERCDRALLLSINGIAAGMRNTG
jgi:phosphoenolpyruvate carboxylase